MRNDILELREVIKKLIPMLTKRNLEVTQTGSEAYVIPDKKTKQPKTVNIPAISENASPEFISAIQGFLDHEVAHVLLTDFSVYGCCDPRNPRGRPTERFTSMHNIVEDTMIEREIVKIFPGSTKNLHNVRQFFLNNIIKPALKGVDEKEEFQLLMVVILRALADHEEMQDYMDKGNYWKNPFVDKFVSMIQPKTLASLKTCSTTVETAQIAADILDILDASVVPPSASLPKDAGDDAGTSSSKGSKSSAIKSPSKTTSKKKEKDEDDSEDEDQASSGAANGSAADEEQDSGDEGSADGSADNESDDEADGSADDESDDEAGGENDSAGSDADSSDANDDGDNADADGDSGADNDGSAGDGSSGDADGEGSGSSGLSYRIEGGEGNEVGSLVDADGNQEGSGGGVGGAQSNTSIFDVPDSALKAADMSAQIAIKISNDSRDLLNLADYTVFSRDFDQIEPLETPSEINKKWIPEMQERTMKMVGVMQKTLERALASQSHVANIPGFKRGRLHAPSLYRLSVSDPRIFTQRHEAQSKNTAVTLLIDNSGSMSGAKMKLAMLSAYALSETLEKVKIKHEVIGFTTSGWGRMPATMEKALRIQSEAASVSFSRVYPIVMPIYKGFDERIDATVRKRIAYAMNAQNGLSENIDGESLLYAVDRISRQPEKRKVVIVLSDGQPSGSRNAAAHLRTVTKKIEATDIELIGIGIKDSSVERFYKNNMVINNIDELPGRIMNELRRILLS